MKKMIRKAWMLLLCVLLCMGNVYAEGQDSTGTDSQSQEQTVSGAEETQNTQIKAVTLIVNELKITFKVDFECSGDWKVVSYFLDETDGKKSLVEVGNTVVTLNETDKANLRINVVGSNNDGAENEDGTVDNYLLIPDGNVYIQLFHKIDERWQSIGLYEAHIRGKKTLQGIKVTVPSEEEENEPQNDNTEDINAGDLNTIDPNAGWRVSINNRELSTEDNLYLKVMCNEPVCNNDTEIDCMYAKLSHVTENFNVQYHLKGAEYDFDNSEVFLPEGPQLYKNQLEDLSKKDINLVSCTSSVQRLNPGPSPEQEGDWDVEHSSPSVEPNPEAEGPVPEAGGSTVPTKPELGENESRDVEELENGGVYQGPPADEGDIDHSLIAEDGDIDHSLTADPSLTPAPEDRGSTEEPKVEPAVTVTPEPTVMPTEEPTAVPTDEPDVTEGAKVIAEESTGGMDKAALEQVESMLPIILLVLGCFILVVVILVICIALSKSKKKNRAQGFEEGRFEMEEPSADELHMPQSAGVGVAQNAQPSEPQNVGFGAAQNVQLSKLQSPTSTENLDMNLSEALYNDLEDEEEDTLVPGVNSTEKITATGVVKENQPIRNFSVQSVVVNNKGRVRKNNEDNFYMNGTYMARDKMDDGASLWSTSDDALQLYAVCDGMGGADSGEEASHGAVRELYLRKGEHETWMDPHVMTEAIRSISDTVYEEAEKRGQKSGTTIVLMLLKDGCAQFANVGDSRIYRYRDQKLTQISLDHSRVQRMISMGILTPEQARTDPSRHVITQYLGMPPEMKASPYYTENAELVSGDIILLCSDGLSDMVEDSQMESIMQKHTDLKNCAQELLDTALQNGGRDNVTIMLVKVTEEAKSDRAPRII
ncbi:MAG: protein phosphatase 2C domain-containing protein [Eubacteriales bacterium]|nr:protein phosphatase 2C domain-containing protein [Eubacteriales bacterium]